ncbi:STAS domain-containing protein [Comamonas aquatilis]|uniref:hypothetical protein n=1 Tax=Comamonas aquatilis TaxID=1778406 RepID=UPI0039EF89B9
MAIDETKLNGLLSKVARFVRHPTVNWSDLDNLNQEEPESQYSKQALKEMIERKRQNDFVRKREFEQLRKLRASQLAQQAQGNQPKLMPSLGSTMPGAPSSVLQTLNSNLGERAVTLKKIDEIEAQMSQQWWRGKQAADATTMPMPLPAGGNPTPTSFRAPSPGATVPLLNNVVPGQLPQPGQAGSGFEPTRPLDLAASAPASILGRGALLGETEFAAGFAPTEVSGPAPDNMIPPSFVRFEHDWELEEAAIVFANGDAKMAQALLQALLDSRSADLPRQLPVWLALLDLYRAAGWQAEFDESAVDFASRFGRSAPQWFAMPQEHGGLSAVAELEGDANPAASGLNWTAPAQLTLSGLQALHVAKSRSPAPWALDWSALQSLDAGVMRPMHALVMQWADEGGALAFTGVEQLQAVLRALTPSGAREVDTGWWHLRLALLRLMHMQDDFELTALDYCVTYEVSPPSWVDPVCAVSHDGAVQDVFALDSRMLIPDTLVPPMLGRDLPHRFALQGVIEGDALPWLTSIQEQAHLGETISINCARLVRMDFAAAGSVLNWTSSMQALGHVLQFSQLHQLVAVFFNVVGIQEHAQVQPRHD